ncbi:MAG TPA: superoxide dismutase family protein [Actinomycetota bacterium]|nr:superoxide dismutase family protein [Actinomycetota bacterium]
MARAPRIRVVSTLSLAVLVAVVALASTPSRGLRQTACFEQKKARAVVRNADGDRIGVVDFWNDSNCVVRVTAKFGRFNLEGKRTGLTEGFHGFHLHTTGTCEPDAEDPLGNVSPFFTAGGHWNPDSSNHGAHKGDLPPLLATDAGLARANVLTDRFRIKQLFDDDGTAVIVHAGSDNLANIPAETPDGADRYHSHPTNEMGADETTRSTGDSGARFACGVVKRVARRG